jgi:hypothetical protein
MQLTGGRREELFSLTQTQRNSFTTSQKQFLTLIRNFSSRKEALSDGTNEVVLESDGTMYVKPRSPLSTRKRKETLHKTLLVLRESLPQKRTRKLQQAILDLTNSLRFQHPEFTDLLNAIQKGTIVTVLADVIHERNIDRLLTFDENAWTLKHISKLLMRGNQPTSDAHYISTVLVAKWMEHETLETCLRRDSAITCLLKCWLYCYDNEAWITDSEAEYGLERRALIHFVACLERLQRWPAPLLKVVRMIQYQIDVRQLQDSNGPPIMITVLMLRHFIPLYHMRSANENKTEIARVILSYCDAVPLIAHEHYREVSKLLRA